MASKASADAQKLAEEKGVDLEAITGSGKDGSITKQDVQDFVGYRDQDLGVNPSAVQAAAAEGDEAEVVQPKPNPKRASEEVVVYLDGERLAYPGGRALFGSEWDRVSKEKGEARDGSRVALLVKGGAS